MQSFYSVLIFSGINRLKLIFHTNKGITIKTTEGFK